TMKCIRLPKAELGTQWKKVRCNQYSAKVHNTKPKTARTRLVVTFTPARATLYHRSAPTAGPYRRGTTEKCVREKASTNVLSNILGDSLVARLFIVSFPKRRPRPELARGESEYSHRVASSRGASCSARSRGRQFKPSVSWRIVRPSL